jgi:tRNA pseudouridine38-40 synthase
MRNVLVRLSYDGSKFFGWQRQAGFESVQGALENALESLTGEHVTVHGSGRTDTGVHAIEQTASFHVETSLDDVRLLHALNAHLGPAAGAVVLHGLETRPDDFHAQRSARGKRYLYVVRNTPFPAAFGRQHHHWVRGPLDLARMRRGARHLVGEHDFTSFASAGSPRSTNVRRVAALHLRRRRDTLYFVIQGTGFLYNMVRAIAGTLLEVGKGKLEPDAVATILAARSRGEAGPTAPASGLYLLRVLYPPD